MNKLWSIAIVALLVVQDRVLAVDQHQPLVVPHRGLSRHTPENTLTNFRACLELGLGFEFDVHRTKDGHLVCIHDDTVHRTTNGRGLVAQLDLAEIRTLDAGNWFDSRFKGEKVPTVEEVLKLVAEHRHKNILVAVDLKAKDVERDVVALAIRVGAIERLVFIGRAITESSVRDAIRQVSAKAHPAILVGGPDGLPDAVGAANAGWVYFRFVPTASQMEHVHKAGKRGFIAGVAVAGHLPDAWKSAASAGIDGILTDYPLELSSVIRGNNK